MKRFIRLLLLFFMILFINYRGNADDQTHFIHYATAGIETFIPNGINHYPFKGYEFSSALSFNIGLNLSFIDNSITYLILRFDHIQFNSKYQIYDWNSDKTYDKNSTEKYNVWSAGLKSYLFKTNKNYYIGAMFTSAFGVKEFNLVTPFVGAQYETGLISPYAMLGLSMNLPKTKSLFVFMNLGIAIKLSKAER